MKPFIDHRDFTLLRHFYLGKDRLAILENPELWKNLETWRACAPEDLVLFKGLMPYEILWVAPGLKASDLVKGETNFLQAIDFLDDALKVTPRYLAVVQNNLDGILNYLETLITEYPSSAADFFGQLSYNQAAIVTCHSAFSSLSRDDQNLIISSFQAPKLDKI